MDDITQNNYRRAVNRIIQQYTVSPEVCLHGWIILIDNRIWINTTGCFLWDTRDKAVRAFYNHMKWRASRIMREENHEEFSMSLYHNHWKIFKEILGDRLQIKQI